MNPIVYSPDPWICVLPDVLAPDACASLIAIAERAGFTDAPITTGFGFVMAPEIRNNTRVMADDPATAAQLYARIAQFVPAQRGAWRALGLNERLRFYRYEVGQKFAWHHDGAFARTPDERSQITVMFYLNDGFEGGETEFENGPRIPPRRGSVLLFDHWIRHQGAEVARGCKYVLRTDLIYARHRADAVNARP